MSATNGLCECGCGLMAPIAQETTKRYGYTKGQPKRYRKGHHRNRTTKAVVKGYRTRVIGGRKVDLHRLRAEGALGRPLPLGAEVHHADGTRSEHSPLVICQDGTYHKLLHVRMRVLRAGGNPNTDRICYKCQRVQPVTNFTSSPINKCKDCSARANAEYRKTHRDTLRAYMHEYDANRRQRSA